MRDEKLLPGNIERIGVFRALQLGDLLCSTPALRALRAAFPNAQISLIGLPWAQDFVDRLDYVDRLLPFPGFPGLPECQPDLQSVPVRSDHSAAWRRRAPFGHPCALAVTAQTVVRHARALLRKELLHAA